MSALQAVASAVAAAAQTDVDLKGALERSIPFDSGWLHVIAGPLIFLAAAFLLRKPLSSWWPWFVVLAAELVNEGLDLGLGSTAPVEIRMSGVDLVLTMALPTAMLVMSRVMESRRDAPELPR